MELTARVRREAGMYWAEVTDLPGCFASGATLDELNEALGEAIRMYLGEGDAPSATEPLRVDELKLTA